MAKYIDKSAVVAEIERRQKIHFNDYHINGNNSPADYGACNALTQILAFIDTLEVKEINNVWHDTRRTIPEDGSEQIICIKEDGLAVLTSGKIVNGTIKWAYLGDLLNININVEVKEEILDKEGKTKLMKKCVHKAYQRGYDMGVLQTTNKIKHNTKKVDLEKEFDNYAKDILACDVQFEPFTHLYNCAKYFYELGLKAQKGGMIEALRTEYEKGRADVIEKACEFLKSYRQDTFDGTGYISGIINDETIEEFKKVVEK